VILSLGGCQTDNGETFGQRLATDPSKYELYTCRDLEVALIELKKRELELRHLMDKSSQGPGGGFVNLIVYQDEYSQTQGYERLAWKEQRAKNCVVRLKHNH
jgi:hypothetical protein